MAFPFVLGVDENIIQIYNVKDIKLFHKDFINVALENCQNVGQFKRHHLILKIAVSGPENCLLLIFLANSHPVIGIGEFKLNKLPSLP